MKQIRKIFMTSSRIHFPSTLSYNMLPNKKERVIQRKNIVAKFLLIYNVFFFYNY